MWRAGASTYSAGLATSGTKRTKPHVVPLERLLEPLAVRVVEIHKPLHEGFFAWAIVLHWPPADVCDGLHTFDGQLIMTPACTCCGRNYDAP